VSLNKSKRIRVVWKNITSILEIGNKPMNSLVVKIFGANGVGNMTRILIH
jgi:hypothetical protein